LVDFSRRPTIICLHVGRLILAALATLPVMHNVNSLALTFELWPYTFIEEQHFCQV